MKPCCTCKYNTPEYLGTYPCCSYQDGKHWEEVDQVEYLIKQILEHVFPREQAIVKAQLDRLIAEVKGEKNDDT